MLGLYTLFCDAELYTPDTMSEASGMQGTEWVDSIRGVAYEKWEGPNVEGRGLAPPPSKNFTSRHWLMTISV